MPHADLPSYRDGFLQKFLAELPGAPALAALESQQPAGQPLTPSTRRATDKVNDWGMGRLDFAKLQA